MVFIFDCDGTLVDSEYLNNRALSEILAEEGFPQYTPEKCLEFFTGFSLEDCLRSIKETHGTAATFNDRDIIKRYTARTIANMERDLKIDPQTIPTLSHLHSLGIDMVVASNGEFEIVRETVWSAGLADFFPLRKIFTKDMVSYPKPAPDLFLFAIRKSQSMNAYCIVVEDSVPGVIAAKSAGLRVIGITGFAHDPVKRHKDLLAAGADYVIEKIEQLRDFVNHPQKNDAQIHTGFAKAQSK